MQNENRPSMAFLGPLGTYSHQIAHDLFGDSVTYVERDSIADVYNAVSTKIPFAIIPQENSIHGSVNETYDLLRSRNAGQTKFVRDEVTLTVQHCLLVRRGVKLRDITKVLSHEQALGQCSQYLSENLPLAERVKVASTAAAADAIMSDTSQDSFKTAAICSKVCITIYKGLEVLREGIQNDEENLTRFWVLALSLDIPLPYSPDITRPPRVLVRLQIPPKFPDHEEAGHSELACALRVLSQAIRIDRRPCPKVSPFQDLYFVENEWPWGTNHPQVANVTDWYACRLNYAETTRVALDQLNALGVESVILGAW